MKPVYTTLLILGAGVLFYILTGDVSIAFLLIIMLGYFEFRKKSHPYH